MLSHNNEFLIIIQRVLKKASFSWTYLFRKLGDFRPGSAKKFFMFFWPYFSNIKSITIYDPYNENYIHYCSIFFRKSVRNFRTKVFENSNFSDMKLSSCYLHIISLYFICLEFSIFEHLFEHQKREKPNFWSKSLYQYCII